MTIGRRRRPSRAQAAACPRPAPGGAPTTARPRLGESLPRRALFVLAGLAVSVAACGATVTPAPTASPGGAPGGSPSGSSGPSPSASSAASASPSGVSPSAIGTSTSPASAGPGPTTAEPTPAGSFACGYPFQRAATRSDPVAAVRDVRVGAHDSYDRIVFEFAGGGVPSLRIDRATPPFRKDPSDLPLPVAGTAFISLRMTQASGAGYAQSNGQPTYTGPTAFQAGYSRLTALVEQGDFEGIFSWIAGLSGSACYQVTELPNPARLVIDLQAAP